MTNRLELLLRKAGRELADYQVARFFKVPEEMAQTPSDFFGYTAHGRAILIEAKMVHRASLPIADDPGLQAHQWNELMDAHRAGAIALICWSQGQTCATISMDVAITLAADRKSIPWKAIPPRFFRPLVGPLCWLRLLEPWISIEGAARPASAGAGHTPATS
jgi:hypothetical protein